MKLCMWVRDAPRKVLKPVAGLVIAPFKRKAAGGRLLHASIDKDT